MLNQACFYNHNGKFVCNVIPTSRCKRLLNVEQVDSVSTLYEMFTTLASLVRWTFTRNSVSEIFKRTTASVTITRRLLTITRIVCKTTTTQRYLNTACYIHRVAKKSCTLFNTSYLWRFATLRSELIFFLYLLKYCGVCVCVCVIIVFPSVLFPVVCERVNFGSLEIIKLRIRYWIYFVFLYCSVSVLERTYAENG